jgi:hypothetical protein
MAGLPAFSVAVVGWAKQKVRQRRAANHHSLL